MYGTVVLLFQFNDIWPELTVVHKQNFQANEEQQSLWSLGPFTSKKSCWQINKGKQSSMKCQAVSIGGARLLSLTISNKQRIYILGTSCFWGLVYSRLGSS